MIEFSLFEQFYILEWFLNKKKKEEWKCKITHFGV